MDKQGLIKELKKATKKKKEMVTDSDEIARLDKLESNFIVAIDTDLFAAMVALAELGE